MDGNDYQKLEIRIRALETWRSEQVTSNAVWQERRQSDREEFQRLNTRLDRIDGHINKIVWLIVTAIIGGLMAFVINGGLANAGG